MTNSTLLPSLSVVIPVLNEEDNLPALAQRLKEVAASLPSDHFEFIFVDDGSTDQSYKKLAELALKDNRIKAVRLSRNFGSHSACLAGLAQGRGQRFIIIAADLQDPPELILKLVTAQENGVDVVWAVREKREDSRRVLFFAQLYNRFMRRFIFKGWPGDGADVVLLTRRVRDALLAACEKNTSIFCQIFWFAFPQTCISYVKEKRNAGRSKWTLSKRLKLAFDSVISFSFLPVRMISYTGMVLSLIGFFCAAAMIALYIFGINIQEPGWASLMCAILIISGIQTLMLGVIGEYLWRAADQGKSRPFYVVTEQTGFEMNTSGRHDPFNFS